MAVIDYKAIAGDLIAKITKSVKATKGTFAGDPTFHELGENEFMVQVDCMETLSMCDVISTVISKHKYGVIIREETHEGFFDWRSDTYIKDCVTVTFGVK